MYDLAAISSWIEFAVRWVHVITGIAWIGSSFYFIALDLGLHRDRNLASGADGEEWQVHGGGFYHIQKYLIAPDQMPGDLIWFKWESYATWLSGFALLVLVYYLGAEFYLVDPSVADIGTVQAVLISLASLTFGWIAYDQICKSKFGDDNTRLMILLYVILVGMAYFYTSVFSGRAALLHLGAFTATIMSANVFFIIMPNQRIVVADLQAGRTPDAKYGKIAKQRSTHNNYLTLPVIFMMLSNHYPLAFASEMNWLIAALVFLMGVTIRHYFNTVHMRAGNPIWTWLVTALIFVVIMWLSTAPMFQAQEREEAHGPALRFAQAEGFADVQDIVMGRCSMCHAAEPAWEGMHWPPKGVRLETEHQIAMAAKEIYLQAGLTHAMPPANLSYMQQDERAQIIAWYTAATK
ncbi:urate hydroxylase PuuD [Sulfitobacter mediterraneus]|uniref:urate hydroxylase PuuD n=1 Tax=Sulfitobacter mediterraneus TaxID=83219 RepID=UPI00193A0D8C|nr:urate hydroxylase PuuD [Sulfitobacter mediterraneus]MBM1555047.1 urate hydroxylase PuuD [Sulfitobacter mediterraneus]MBM1567400.1 urate hydroxylase PuuD [Sulfitobacter mediterraneus]MBM1571202.1 urate hydroxylase PuuD [Sulfitobacter mediterraneus]MBM1575002.1 urate hydroxylase PuuD [Sulfitobacter mediterraneus]MBM1578005.1 urate hydroxylase PuuD [Sulfitobacter mediterraneus]